MVMYMYIMFRLRARFYTSKQGGFQRAGVPRHTPRMPIPSSLGLRARASRYALLVSAATPAFALACSSDSSPKGAGSKLGGDGSAGEQQAASGGSAGAQG